MITPRALKLELPSTAHSPSNGVATASPCRLDLPTAGHFDLTALRKEKEDYQVAGLNNETYYINFCGPIKKATWAIAEGADTVGAYFEGSRGGISLGQYNAAPTYSSINGALTLTYSGGSVCTGSTNRRTSIINLQCDNSWSSRGPVIIGTDDCAYFFSFKTPHACPTTVASSAWSLIFVLFSFFALAGFVSFLSAVMYNRLVLKKRGIEQIPSIERVKEGLSFAKEIAVIGSISLFSTAQALFKSTRQSFNSSPGVDYTRGAWSRSARAGFSRVPEEDPIIVGDEDEEDADDERDSGPGVTHSRFKDDD